MARLTDLIREQSSQEAGGSDVIGLAHSMGKTGLPIPPSTLSPSTVEVDWYHRATHELQGIKHAVQTRQLWKFDELTRIASGVVASLGTNDKLVQEVLERHSGDYLINNAVNVAIVSVKIAEALRYESAKLEQCALAGFLHDLGMFALPDSLVCKTGSLTEEELRSLREHPQHGARLFKESEAVYPWVGRVILQEHERWDGSGYPDRRTGDQIDEMAFVVGLADVFDALMGPRPYRRGMSPHRAICTLIASGKTLFPYHILKALVDQFSVYPLGTKVRLNTGETGVVSQLNRQYALRPILQVSQQPGSSHGPASKTVDLRAETSLHIVEVVPIG
ncbi:MAG: HD domain-containing protein [Nitrospirae bacterium]|nr:HD domain-containing protein [Nitrospirota bacterium]